LWLSLAIKLFAGAAGIGAGGTGLWAATLWLQASKITIPEMEPPQASVEDAPALYAYTVMTGVYDAHLAFSVSGQLNAQAARLTAVASGLAGLAAFLAVL
jgi:hypothetical protein